ncbi:dihydroxyacetone kinase subunit DhaK [Pseudolactococcus insecticola]|uniref:Dihydroxyacetone kinase subunit DhaK n=1 Tax=Pseudolactococcus insecticola TaxID=2709158 RepID=A0A6A0B4M6_9LACT|nr:dihydroxyacetone kinase subunit DhaK [Lactococcus insecticola]GFH39976.1 dihydroxyacetone kinase subunit DhaK [Lactococcus insecticola]
MKKIINQPADVVDQMLSGLTRAYPSFVRRLADTDVLVRTVSTSQVQLISGGGSGHEPSHAGFVGDGMLSAAVCGQVFTSPTPDQIYEAAKAVDTGAGVFFIIKNYSGDVMNFDMAKDMAELDGIAVDFVIVDDDIAVENSTYTQGKRGVAGTVLVHKILGDAARNGASLSDIKAQADKLIPQIHTLAVALSGATVPEVGKPGFVLADDEIEFGVGIHGEPGYRREKMAPSQALAKELVTKLLASYDGDNTSSYAILVNGMGATPLMEQFIFINDVLDLLSAAGITVAFQKVGNLMTSIDMAGISLTMVRLSDPAWLDALNADVTTIAWG